MPQHTAARPLRWSILVAPVVGALVLAGCTPGAQNGEGNDGGDAAGAGFSLMVSQANDADDHYINAVEKYAEETGIDVEVIPYPADAYNTQVTTQLQAGNAADLMILAPGTGQPISIITLSEAGFLEPLDETSASTVPAGAEALFGSDGEVYGQPTGLAPVGLVFNAGAGAEVDVAEYPQTYEDLLDACTSSRDGGKTFSVLAGAIPFNTGLLAQLISATRVYAENPDWNDERLAGDVTFADTAGWQETLETIVEMNESGCFQDGAAGGTFDNITANLGGGTALTAALPGAAATSIGEATGAELTLQIFPPAKGQDPMLMASANYAWGLNAKASDEAKASAQAFLDWVAEPEEATILAEDAGLVPIASTATEDLLPPYQPVGELLETGAYVGLANATWPNPATYDALGAGVQGLLTGQKTPQQVLEEMDAAWDQ